MEEPDFKVLAPKIIEECSGLPIAITTVASALRNKSLAVWDDARTQLKRSIITDIQGMEASVYKSVKLSYDFLRSESQLLLLFCSLHVEDLSPHIDFLLKYAIGWSLFQDVYKLEETRDRVYTLTEELLARSLLLRDPNNHNCVRVHDIIRDCSLLIAANERKMHRITDARQLKCIADNGAKSLKDSVAIFLSNKHGVQLPERLECPNLKFLFLRRGRIPDQFFEKSEELRVLDMSRVKLQQLPSSICVLQSLRTLCIWDCHKLLDITFIGDLKLLEVLTVVYCSICKVPKQIGQLTRLRSLDLNECYNLKTIESDVLSKLTKLEELNLSSDRKIDWKNTGVDGESSNASLTEVKNLPQLAALNLEIDDADILPQNFFSEKLERYEILIGDAFDDDDDLVRYKCDAKRMLQVCLTQRKLPKEKGLEVLLKNSQVLYLDGLENVSNFSYELDTKGFEQTKCLVLQNSNGIQHMVNSTEQTHPCGAFQSLEFLRLRSMKKLEKICHGELRPESFAKLKVIQVISCDKLRNLFHYSIAVCLSQLETIKVRDCEMMEEIVINEGQIVGSEIIFPQLRFLELKNVPKLSNYISELDPPQRSTSPLFCGKLADPTSFLKLSELFVEDSHFIKYLFSSSVAENLLQLNRLEIRNCSMLEEIIVVNQKMDKLLFPQLSFVMLDNLPKLKRFCSGAVLEFPLLTEIKMKGCPELMTFVSISENK